MKQDNKDRNDDALVFRIAQLFIGERAENQSPTDIAEQVTREFRRQPALTREAIYPLIAEAVRRGFLRLVPPISQQLAEKVSARYPNLQSCTVRVVETAGPHDNAKVAIAAADLALEHLGEITRAKKGQPVGLGLGPGRATLDFCRALGRLLEAGPEPVKLKLVAISAGCPANAPEYASISFFNLFPPQVVDSKVGLFAETLVPLEAFAETQLRAGVKEAFQARASIDLVVASMGDAQDKDDLLCMFLEQSGADLASLRAAGWVGNVQYRPYTTKGPVKEQPTDLRAVTLYELEDLVRIAGQKNKHVILMARQCGLCGRTRADALRPLLTNPGLQVFSSLVLDAATTRELLK
jgi:DNA-binding transcriptional regulator LsrR (DeoR family)